MNYEQVLKDALEETGVELNETKDKSLRMIALKGAQLAAAANEPGFDLAVRAARNSIALKLGLDASLQARAADARIVGVIQTILFGLATA